MPTKAKKPAENGKAKRKPFKRPPSCTQAEKDAVDRFLAPLLKGAEDSVVKYRAVQKSTPSALVTGTLNYWRSVVKALRWAKATNLQRRT